MWAGCHTCRSVLHFKPERRRAPVLSWPSAPKRSGAGRRFRGGLGQRTRSLVLALLASACGPCAREPYVGSFTLLDRGSRFLIAAPHGEFDENTAQVVLEFCAKTRWDCLVAEGFRDEDVPINVNRPTEGIRLVDERATRRAARVYERYVERLQALSTGVTLYVEIHGHEFDDLKDTIEVATVGVSKQGATMLEGRLRQALNLHGLNELVVRTDVLHTIRFNATSARRSGSLSLMNPALHIELPHSVRAQLRPQLVAALVDSLDPIAKRLTTSRVATDAR